jgi:hypothetical protein
MYNTCGSFNFNSSRERIFFDGTLTTLQRKYGLDFHIMNLLCPLSDGPHQRNSRRDLLAQERREGYADDQPDLAATNLLQRRLQCAQGTHATQRCGIVLHTSRNCSNQQFPYERGSHTNEQAVRTSHTVCSCSQNLHIGTRSRKSRTAQTV